MPIFLLLLGGPGAGKGTQADVLCKEYALPHIASGDLFRDNLKRATPLGQLAKQYMDRGELVPDDVTIKMIRERLQAPDAKGGALLDGFPRTVPQAEALDTLLAEFGGKVTSVLYIKVGEKSLLERLSGRWICRGAQQHAYHLLFNPPKAAGKCDVDGTELYQRDDDTAVVQARRIKVFMEQTAPLISYYQQRQQLLEVDGEQGIQAVTEALRAGVKAATGK
jgi:adenylate kinase